MNSILISPNIRHPYGLLLFVFLVAAGLAGNYFSFPVFLNIDFLFGSIFAMLALQYFGLGWGTLAAALIGSYTYVLWNHPYAIIILGAEALWVGVLMTRRRVGMVLADTLFWLLVGMPLVFFFYRLVMHVPLSSVTFLMTKQASNGMANALLARLIFTGLVLGFRSSQTSFREIIYNLLTAFVVFPGLIMLAIGSRADFAETDHRIRASLLQDSARLDHYVNTWVINRKSAVLKLAETAAVKTPQQMQAHLEQAQKLDSNFLRLGLMDAQATTTAYYPLLDELGHSTIGKNFADGPFIPDLKRTLQPMVSEAIMDRIGIARPMVAARAPVLLDGKYGGYVTGILSLTQIREQLDSSTVGHAVLYTLLDKKNQVIMSNRSDQTVMTPFKRGRGQLSQLDAGISQWVPSVAANTSISDRWQESVYVAQTAVGDLAEWTLILEQPVAPFQKTLYKNYSDKLTLLFVILLAALILAEVLSRQIMGTLDVLGALTRNLPFRVAASDNDIVWPETAIKETNDLIGNFREMSKLLKAQFDEIQEVNETLEQRVADQTAELKASELHLQTIIENEPDCIKIIDAQGRLLHMNPAGLAMIEADALAQVAGRPVLDLIAPEYRAAYWDLHQRVLAGARMQMQFEVIGLKGGRRWLETHAVPMLDHAETMQLAVTHDITERKQMEEQVRQLAFYDPLTLLPNRRLLTDRLGQAMAASKRSACYCALMILDLDNFKPLNDTHGHLLGDLLLIEVARRLTHCVREIDTVGRFGGDEFVVMLSELSTDQALSTAQAQAVAEKIRSSLSEPYLITVHHESRSDTLLTHYCTASIGVVIFMDNETPQDDILKWADAAMYRAKKVGRNTVRFYDSKA
ncbi:diguanylate cyclase with PAS/PAC sensor [Rhodoferax ferrireducens T118]|uniref:Diguanylate cyclase with PAS/PAC sensor n=1 Tax=Albidiferax ferrireducens (strain ATCC BAA-621 / DSM 15236 / T118) TaxID=338969 RepID=Q21VK6_ALBFT|nr:diguanylate cyclase [Rhodoferax ferrireducens]ABD70197.1 diguanylate cyclase with PAS/PAC sensor [Rhodoferax ferrireducens T118]